MSVATFWAASHISSPYGAPRPGGRTHRGCDWSHSTTPGTPIPSPIAGTVISKLAPAPWHGFGDQVTILEGARRWSFSHLHGASPLRVGSHISVGTILGDEGATGTATGPCVHVELYHRGWRDPAPVIASLSHDNANIINQRSKENDVVFLKTHEKRGKDATTETSRWYTFDGYTVQDVKPGEEESFNLVYGQSRKVTEVTIERLREQGKRHLDAGHQSPVAPIPPGAPTTLTLELTGTATPA